VDLASRLQALERAVTRMGVRVLEEELPEEAVIDGGLCKIGPEVVLYVSPSAPPWKRARVLLRAIRRLPHDEVWLPPDIREMLEGEDCGDSGDPLLGWSDEADR
jgi:hypothetical protein